MGLAGLEGSPPAPVVFFLSAFFAAFWAAFSAFLSLGAVGVGLGSASWESRDVAARDLVAASTAAPERATTGRQLMGRSFLRSL